MSTFSSQRSSIHFEGRWRRQKRPGKPFSSECSQHLPGHWDGASAWRQDRGSRRKEKFPEAGRRACREESRAHEDTAGCSPTSPGLWALDESGIPKHEPFSSPQSTSGQQAPRNATQIQTLPSSHLGVLSMEWALQYPNLSHFCNSVLLAWETNSQQPKWLHPG